MIAYFFLLELLVSLNNIYEKKKKKHTKLQLMLLLPYWNFIIRSKNYFVRILEKNFLPRRDDFATGFLNRVYQIDLQQLKIDQNLRFIERTIHFTNYFIEMWIFLGLKNLKLSLRAKIFASLLAPVTKNWKFYNSQIPT